MATNYNGWYAYTTSTQTIVAHLTGSAAEKMYNNPARLAGPYATKAQAQAAIGEKSGSGSGSGTGSGQTSKQWWVVEGVVGGPSQPSLYNIVQSSAKPTSQGQVVAGPFATKAQAQAWITKTETDLPGAHLAGLGAPNPLSGLSSIGDFFSRLGEANTWIRVGEVVIGVILIAVGVAETTNAVPIATKIAGYVK